MRASEAEINELNMAMESLGITDGEGKRAWIRDNLKRHITSARDLTADEALRLTRHIYGWKEGVR